MKVRQGQDGLFYVESSSKRDVEEFPVNIAELACGCADDCTRRRALRRASPQVVPWPGPNHNICKHTTQVLLFLGLQVQGQLKKQQA